jgi:hypothetical protein
VVKTAGANRVPALEKVIVKISLPVYVDVFLFLSVVGY